MARSLRIQFAGAYYHVTCRGNDRRAIFRDDEDRAAFLEHLKESAEIYNIRLLCYVLMPNHFHLLIQTLKPNLSEFMHRFNVSYTMAFNHRNRRCGHLYQGRYHAVIIDKDSYLLELSRYLHLNPVRTKETINKSASETAAELMKYFWSSYRGYISLGQIEKCIDYSQILEFFGADPVYSRKRYELFVMEGLQHPIKDPFRDVFKEAILGDKSFIDRIKEEFLNREEDEKEKPILKYLNEDVEPYRALQAVSEALGLEYDELIARKKLNVERCLAMEVLHRCCGLKQSEIGKFFGGIGGSTVSLHRKKFLHDMQRDSSLRTTFEMVVNRSGSTL
jgi:REP element-mobilizing transposase RayT